MESSANIRRISRYVLHLSYIITRAREIAQGSLFIYWKNKTCYKSNPGTTANAPKSNGIIHPAKNISNP